MEDEPRSPRVAFPLCPEGTAEFVLATLWLAVVLSIGSIGLLYWLIRHQAATSVARRTPASAAQNSANAADRRACFCLPDGARLNPALSRSLMA